MFYLILQWMQRESVGNIMVKELDLQLGRPVDHCNLEQGTKARYQSSNSLIISLGMNALNVQKIM